MYMKAISWELLKSFHSVVNNRSLSGAARELGTTQPTIGRHIDELEKQLGLSLFLRSRDGLEPTKDALDILPNVENMAGSYSAFLRAASGEKEDEGGVVRLATSEVMGVEILPDMLQAFQRHHPNIAVELVISNQVENLLRRDADIAIRMAEPKQKALVAVRLGSSPIGLYAHKSYLEEYGNPADLADLKKHSLIGPDRDLTILASLESAGIIEKREQIKFRTDNQVAQLALLRSGAGITGMPIILANRDNNLVRVVPVEIDMPVWLVMHEDLRVTKRVRLLFDFLKDQYKTLLNPSDIQ
jgi:DNA-binding transcriptional LysR family regulator